MLEFRQNLPFLTKPFPKQIGGQGQVNEFDGDLLLELPIGAMREIDSTHAAPPQEAVKLIGADALAEGRSLLGHIRSDSAGRGETLFGLAGLEQRPHLGGELAIPPAPGLNQFHACFCASRESLVEDRLNLRETCLV